MGTVVVLARAPEAGRVKRRLETTLGRGRTFALYRAFLADTLEAARKSGARSTLLVHSKASDFEEQVLADRAIEQRGASFGERLDAAILDASRLHGSPVVCLGPDTPHLGPDAIRRAFELLGTTDAVLGPSTSGRLHLLGFTGEPHPVAPAFARSSGEAAAVAKILRTAHRRMRLTEACFDVATPADMGALVQRLALLRESGAPWAPPRTIGLLTAWDMLSS